MRDHEISITGWWFQPTPLKNDGVRQLGWWNYHKRKHKMFQTTNKIVYVYIYIYIGIYIGIMGYNGKQWNICTYITISICAMVKLHGFNRIRGIWSIPQQESTHHGCLFIPLRRFMLVPQNGCKIQLLIMDACSIWNICLHERHFGRKCWHIFQHDGAQRINRWWYEW